MSDLYLYTPDVCDGRYCPMDCDNCNKHDDALAAQEEEDSCRPWTQEPMTEKQRRCIEDMQEFSSYNIPRFTGKTKGEAHRFIEEWGRLAFEDPNSPMFGY